MHFQCARHPLKHFIEEETEALRNFGKESKEERREERLAQGHIMAARGLSPGMSNSTPMEDTESRTK